VFPPSVEKLFYKIIKTVTILNGVSKITAVS